MDSCGVVSEGRSRRREVGQARSHDVGRGRGRVRSGQLQAEAPSQNTPRYSRFADLSSIMTGIAGYEVRFSAKENADHVLHI